MDHVTRHARARMQQRGIRPEAPRGAPRFWSRDPRRARARPGLFRQAHPRARLARATAVAPGSPGVAPAKAGAQRVCNTYAIVASDGTVITVGHRYRRLKFGV